LDSDAVFAVKQSLTGEVGTVSAEQAAQLKAVRYADDRPTSAHRFW
jgi:hypothetical protein